MKSRRFENFEGSHLVGTIRAIEKDAGDRRWPALVETVPKAFQVLLEAPSAVFRLIFCTIGDRLARRAFSLRDKPGFREKASGDRKT